MKYAYDLHIHSVLSPCADVLMTPNNIFNMAKLKNLDIIAITDHNSLKQLAACHELSKSYDMLLIYGVEVTVKENFDVLCYFKTIDDALKFDLLLEPFVKKKHNEHPFLNEQHIMDAHDEMIDVYPYLLSEPLDLSIDELNRLLEPYEHILILAHVDRTYRSGKSYIKQINFDAIELMYEHDNDYKTLNKPILHNSDAHQITDIKEKTNQNTIELDDLDIDSFFRYFKHD